MVSEPLYIESNPFSNKQLYMNLDDRYDFTIPRACSLFDKSESDHVLSGYDAPTLEEAIPILESEDLH